MKRFDCKTCENKEICKFTDEADKISEQLEKIKFSQITIFSIDFSCNKYKKDIKVRDNVLNGTDGWTK